MANPAEKAILRLSGLTDDEINSMSDEECAEDVEQLLDSGILVPPNADCVLPRRPSVRTEAGTGDQYLNTEALLRRLTWHDRQWIWSLVMLGLGIVIGLLF